MTGNKLAEVTPTLEEIARKLHLYYCQERGGSVCPCHVVAEGMTEGCHCKEETVYIMQTLRPFITPASTQDWTEEFLEHIKWMRDHADNRIEQTQDSGVMKGYRCIPADSQLNAYLQGQRDTATELLARAREFKKFPTPAAPTESVREGQPDCDCGVGNDAYLARHAKTCALAKWAEPRCPHCGKGPSSPSVPLLDVEKGTK